MSCTSVFFDHSQPVDATDIKQVPEEFIGSWKYIQKNEEEFINIDSNSFHKITIDHIRMLKSLADSSKNYRIENGKIYFLNFDITKGYPFKLKGDSIYFDEKDEEIYVLSDSVLLKPARNCYVLNIKKKNWWELVFIQKENNGIITISYPISSELLEMKSDYNLMVIDSTREDTVMFHADFKARNIEKILNKDGEGVIYTLKPDSTFVEVDK